MKASYRNDYEQGTDSWKLAEAGQELGNEVVSGDSHADAMDRLTVALYRIGAALTQSLDNLSFQIGQLNNKDNE